jgi:rhodanese-related sulfurtransferase
MTRYIEFIANHPFLTASAAALIGVIVAYEFNRATRGFADLEPADAPRLINSEDAVIIDTRNATEYEKGHVLNALNVPEAELEARLDGLIKHAERPVIVYCGSGVTSGRFATQLVKAGIKRVFNLKGGLAAWQTAGLPVTKGRKRS